MLILFWFKKVRSALEQQVMLKLQSYQYQERALQGPQIRLPVSPYYYEVSHRCSIFDLSNEIPVLIWCTCFTAHTASFLGATKNKEEHGKKKQTNPQLWQFFTVRLQFWKPQQLRFNDPEFGETFQGTVVLQSLSRVWLSGTSWTEACHTSLSFTVSQSLLKLMSIQSAMSSNHLVLCRLLLLLPSIFPTIRAFPNEPALPIRWPKY